MSWKSVVAAAFAAICTVTTSLQAQTLITFETRAEPGSVTGVPVDANITGGTLSRGAGVGLNAGGTFNSAGWSDGADLAGAIAANNYYSFTVNVASGFTASIGQIQIRYDRSGTGPTQLAILSSVNGFTAASTPIYTDTDVNANGEPADITVAGHSGLAGTVEFRIYAWGASSSAGTFDIEVYPNITTGPGIGIIVNGTTSGGGEMTGACCSSGLCTTVAQASCSGVYQGDNTSCSPNPCPQVIGACCINGACVVNSSQADCLANGTGSSWGGAGTTCATFACNPATGACCDATGACTADVSQNTCSGVFTPNGSCTPNLCDDGACCNPAAGTCFLAFDQASCTAVNGTFQGFATTCAANPCPAVNGACCTAGVCTLTADGLGCRSGGGVYLGVGTTCTPTGCNRATGANLVAKYDFDVNVIGGGSRNLTFVTSVNPPFPTGDQFGVAQRYVDPNLPFGLLDDSVFIFSGDTQGVIPESKVDSWFGVVDLFDQIVPSNPGTATAIWTFDITGFSNLNLAIDAAAMGDFELAPIADFFTFTVSIDGGAPVTVFTAGADEAGSQSYTMANGVIVPLDDPFVVTGSTTSPLTLTNLFQTLSANIAGTGSTLTLTLTAFGDGADEAYAFDNITITGTPVGAQTGACCVTGVCSVVTQAACSGTYQGDNSACTPNPCTPATGACCCGSNCSVSTAAACTGTNRSFAGGGTACQPGNTVCCRGDFNKTGAPASVQDIFDFLSGYFSVDPCADSNDSGTISVQDIFDFLSAYFGGC